MAVIEGFVAPGFEEVADAFSRNFDEDRDTGAAFAAVRDGVPVVDLWGGTADTTQDRAWDRDTLQFLFSGTKGLVATCLLLLVDRGDLALDRPVAAYWPAFAAQGKAAITVAEVVSHRARLPALRTPTAPEQLLDDRRMAAVLASQPAERDPRAAAAYHALTYGWLCGEIVRRISGASVGSFFAEHVAQPLELDLWIGLPPHLEPRVSRMEHRPGAADDADDAEAARRAGDELRAAVLGNPPLFAGSRLYWNDAAFHQAEIPAANAIGTARAMARFYGCLALGGALDGVRVLRESTLVAARRERSRFRDPFHGDPLAFASGFQLQTPLRRFGPDPGAFGHAGAGGSVHGAWPDRGVGFSYAMNRLLPDPESDPRSDRLLDALHAATG